MNGFDTVDAQQGHQPSRFNSRFVDLDHIRGLGSWRSGESGKRPAEDGGKRLQFAIPKKPGPRNNSYSTDRRTGRLRKIQAREGEREEGWGGERAKGLTEDIGDENKARE